MRHCNWLIFALIPGFQFAHAAACPDAKAAEEATDHLHSWNNVYRFFKIYGNCFDASVAEGAEDKIQLLWADRWSALPEMIGLTNKDRRFKKFIWLRIGDATFPRDEFDRVVQHARSECPPGAIDFCHEVLKEAEKLK